MISPYDFPSSPELVEARAQLAAAEKERLWSQEALDAAAGQFHQDTGFVPDLEDAKKMEAALGDRLPTNDNLSRVFVDLITPHMTQEQIANLAMTLERRSR